MQDTQWKRRLRGVLESFGRSKIGAWVILNLASPIDTALMRWSNGRISIPELAYPTLLLRSIGAKSGQPREVTLVYARDGQDYVLIASAAGQARHPSWYYNLKAHPEVSILVGGRTLRCRAEEVSGDERERLWQLATAVYGGYTTYKARTAAIREIPVFRLRPL